MLNSLYLCFQGFQKTTSYYEKDCKWLFCADYNLLLFVGLVETVFLTYR